MTPPVPAIRCRQIRETDRSAVVTLLARGFPTRSPLFWLNALRELGRREPPPGLPKFGYLMECSGDVVGAILLICSTMHEGQSSAVRCNLSSWYVEPAFRAHATLLVAHALRHKEVTYLNVSAAPHTWPIIEAQGFSRYCDGIFVAMPILSSPHDENVKVFDAHQRPDVDFDPFEREVLLEHAGHGCCISLWCATAKRAYPFVFRPRLVKHIFPCAQMIYCSDVGHFVRLAGPIGRYLARRGRFLVIIDANGPVPGLVGKFFFGSMPKFFKGPQRPRLGDLAYTEYAILGV
jgi:hypothetical protein